MIKHKQIIRTTLKSIHPAAYRLKAVGLNKEAMDKKLFTEVITALKKIEDRRDFMQDEIGMDMTMYEEQFFSVIENLMKMCFNPEQLSLIQMYLYQLIPDKEWDGTITLSAKNKKEEIVAFKTPEQVWEVLNKFGG